MSLAERISRSQHVLDFFKPRQADLNEDYPPFHKITNLYGMHYTVLYTHALTDILYIISVVFLSVFSYYPMRALSQKKIYIYLVK